LFIFTGTIDSTNFTITGLLAGSLFRKLPGIPWKLPYLLKECVLIDSASQDGLAPSLIEERVN
jgi:hypothetical protein